MVVDNSKVGFGRWFPVPFGFEAAIVLHKTIGSEPGGPANVTTGRIKRSELLEHRDLAIAYKDVTVR